MIYLGDAVECLKHLKRESVHCCVTSPPYWGLRDYGVPGQIGLEASPDAYVARLVEVFREVRRVLRRDGVLFLNLGDSYYGSTPGSGGKTAKQSTNAGSFFSGGRCTTAYLKPKDLVGIPWSVAFALRTDGWWLRSDIIWAKPNPMPESITDRPTKAHEYIFLLTKDERYYYNTEAAKEPRADLRRHDGHKGVRERNRGGRTDGYTKPRNLVMDYDKRNIRSVWEMTTEPVKEAHFATFPKELVRRCLLAGCRPGGTVLDPFMGSGTTGIVAQELALHFIGCDLNPEYLHIAAKRGLNISSIYSIS